MLPTLSIHEQSKNLTSMNTLTTRLIALTTLLAKRSEVILAFVVVGVVFMMIMPLPTLLVDILIALNISVSTLLVVIVMYLPGPLAFSTFPGILLITTLFRLALSITTTRLILLDADAGEIVEAFGNFVVGGNLVVGIVIFLILMIVNFLVITKGSERIAEVSARFTLDALPGKQMSIDADLRAGMLTATEAQQTRKEISKESQLFGAMDGAMKFVKGDAIAGIIIVLVNIIGGVSIGVSQLEMSTGEALELYAILTIGDGLVAQIPALLIALTAGLMITRVQDKSIGEINVGQEMAGQITSEPKAWIIASCVLIGFSLVPGMPTAAFLVLAMIFLSIGGLNIFLKKEKKILEEKLSEKIVEQQQKPPEEEDVDSFSVYEKISTNLHSKHKETEWFNHFRKSMRKARNEIVLEYAYMLPTYQFKFSDDVPEDEFVLRFYEAPVVRATYGEHHVWIDQSYKEKLDDIGVEYSEGRKEREESHLLWVPAEYCEKLAEHNIPSKTSIEVITKRITEAFFKDGHMFIGLEEAHAVMNWALKNIPELGKECERLLPLPRLTDILKKLASELVSLKSLQKIFETITTHASSERDPIALTETVRVYLRDQICTHIAKDNELSICLLEAETEEFLRESLHKTGTGGYFSIDTDQSEEFIDKIKQHTHSYLDNNESIALVVSQDLRPHIRDLIKNALFKLPVLSYTEISESISVKPIARLSILN